MGRHTMAASSSARARVALGALPLIATVGAIGVGSVVMSPTAAEAPLEPPVAGVGTAAPLPAAPALPGAPLPAAPALPGAPLTVLDLASTGGPEAAEAIVPGPTAGATSTGRGDAEAAPRRTARAGTAGDGAAVIRSASARDADTPTRGSSGGGGGGGSVDRGDSGGGSSGGSSGGSAGSSGAGSGGSGSGSGGSGGSGGGLLGGVVNGVGQTVSGASSLLSFGESSSSSVLSFGS
jgi:hypothetical protein